MVGLGILNIEDLHREPLREPLIAGLFPRKFVEEMIELNLESHKFGKQPDSSLRVHSGPYPLAFRISDSVFTDNGGRYRETDRYLRKAGIEYHKMRMNC